jgi:hypothetical protein
MGANLKGLIRKIAYGVAPEMMQMRAARLRIKYNTERFGGRQRASREALFPSDDIRVLTGPFAGLKYIDEIVWGPIEPKWLGTYESELHDVIGSVLSDNYETIIDIGSADGYYAVGLAAKMPSASVLSFDTDPMSRAQQQRLVKLNGVPNIIIGSFCSGAMLDSAIKGKTLVVCDIEGHELLLLDPVGVKNLSAAAILVELHEFGSFSVGDVEAELRNRFSKTHRVSSIPADPDLSVKQEKLEKLGISVANELVNEYRILQNQIWVWMTPR